MAEFTYVNDITADFGKLHETFSIFRDRSVDEVPGRPVGLRLQEAREIETDAGLGQVTTTIEPVFGAPVSGLTRLTLTAKIFVPEGSNTDSIALLTSAHNAAKSMFYAVVSDQATNEWGEIK